MTQPTLVETLTKPVPFVVTWPEDLTIPGAFQLSMSFYVSGTIKAGRVPFGRRLKDLLIEGQLHTILTAIGQ